MGDFGAIFGALVSAFSSFAGGGGAPSPPPPPTFAPPPTPPSVDDSDIQEKAREEQARRGRASGLSSTVLTSGRGVTEDALTEKKTLLGE